MKYYRVKPQYDNHPRFKEQTNHKLRQDGILIANELYTPRERAQIMNGNWFFDEIEVPKTKTYWFFGARFEKGETK